MGLFALYNQNQHLKESLQALEQRNNEIENEIADARRDVTKKQELLNVLRDKNIIEVDLGGQDIAPDAYATAYWDKEQNITFIDAKNLPEPPRGMVYQVWSLKLSPLTPTSLGLLENFKEDENKIFRLQNSQPSEGFGITLEPAGGSESPTLEKLYALGTISS
ncbi:anti-sigma factor [Antarcticibacterium sp. 1MA-6-2]|uniref:anti-sigma factor n=1 Tax=Antarcticibacterium sp. 1MA-6-2 TaxID=2908210 RepID=UPI00288312BC|nr:anti-sigma factor [Antarcticibacterium sp. 1MA-6-2]